MSRGFRPLKLWMTMKHYGLDGERALRRRSVACAHHLYERVGDHPDFTILHEPNRDTYRFRSAPEDLTGSAETAPDAAESRLNEDLDELNQGMVDAGFVAPPTTTLFEGHRALRKSICSARTTRADVDRAFDALAEAGARLDAEWHASASLPG